MIINMKNSPKMSNPISRIKKRKAQIEITEEDLKSRLDEELVRTFDVDDSTDDVEPPDIDDAPPPPDIDDAPKP